MLLKLEKKLLIVYERVPGFVSTRPLYIRYPSPDITVLVILFIFSLKMNHLAIGTVFFLGLIVIMLYYIIHFEQIINL